MGRRGTVCADRDGGRRCWSYSDGQGRHGAGLRRGGLPEGHARRQHAEPDGLDVAPDGRVFYIERDGRLMIWKPNTQQTVPRARSRSPTSQENGLLGLQLRRTRPATGSTSSTRSCRTAPHAVSRASRSTATRSTCSSEQRILTFQHQRAQCCHSSGSLNFGPDQPVHLHGRQHEPVRLQRLQPDRRALGSLGFGKEAHLRRLWGPWRRAGWSGRCCWASR